jgi:hypothetical protein
MAAITCEIRSFRYFHQHFFVKDHVKRATSASGKKYDPDYLTFVDNPLSSINRAAAIYRNIKQSIAFEVNSECVKSIPQSKRLLSLNEASGEQRDIKGCIFASCINDKENGNASCSHH